MRFGHIELFVTDPKKSADFFLNVLGFSLTTQLTDDLIWIALGEFEILLKKGVNTQISQSYQSANGGIVFYTNNLEEQKQKLEVKGLVFKGFDGSNKCLTFTDPDGHWFQLVNPEDH